jgi:hypothetical protein
MAKLKFATKSKQTDIIVEKAVEDEVIPNLALAQALETKLSERLGLLEEEAKLKQRMTEIGVQKSEMEEAAHEFAETLDIGPGEVHIVKVAGGTLKLGKVGGSKSITDTQAVHDALDDDTFWKVVKFSITDLEKYMTGTELAGLITVTPTKRSLTIKKTS